MTQGLPPTGPLVWAHVGSASVLSAVQDVLARARLHEPSLRVLISATAESGLNGRDIVSFVDDKLAVVLEFLDQNQPDLCIWADASITTPLFAQVHKAGVPVMLIEPHIKDMQKRPWLWRKTAARQALRPVSYALAASTDAAGHLRALGVPGGNIEVHGPLTAGIVPPNFDEKERDHMGDTLTSRPVWLAVTVPQTELEMLADAYNQAQRSAHRMLLILDPQTPELAAQAKQVFEAHGLVVHSRDHEGEPDTLTQVFITDGDFELGLWYRLSTLAYMGGSFSNGAGVPNPLLPAALGCAVLHGPHISTFTTEYARLASAKACVRIDREDDLAKSIADLLAPDRSAELANAGWNVISEGAAVTDHLVDVILDRLGLEDLGA